MTSVKKNFSYNLIYQLFTLIMPLITAPYVSRLLGPSGVGTYSYYYSIATYFTYFELLGVNNYGVRTIAKCATKEKRDQEFCNIYTVQLSCSMVVLSIYILYVILIAKNKPVAFSLMIFVISSMLDVNWYFFGTEQFAITTRRNCIVKILTVILIFTVVRKPTDIVLYSIIISLGYLIAQLIMWFYAFRQIKFVRPQKAKLVPHFKRMLILFIPVIAVSLYKIMDKIMLGFMSDMSQVGYYENAAKIADVPAMLTVALGTAMLPRMSSLISQNNEKRFNDYFQKSIIFTVFAAFALNIGIMSISGQFIPFYYGDEFTASAVVLNIILISGLFSCWASVIRTQYLIPKEQDNIYVQSVILGAVVNIIINALLIPHYAANGAAIGTVMAEASVAIYQGARIGREVTIWKYLAQGSLAAIPTIFMWIIVKNAQQRLHFSVAINMMIEIALGGIIYILIVGLFFIIAKHKRRVL